MVKILSLAHTVALIAVAAAIPLARRQSDASHSGFNSNTQASHDLKAALTGATSYADRQAILFTNPPDASNITFTFINNTVTDGTGGTIALSTVNNFPALIGTEVAMAIGFVNPCGLNVPHSHPRANEFLTVIQGKLIAGLVLELNDGSNGNVEGQPAPVIGPIPQVNVTLSNYKGMLFPQGETHFQFNPTCEPALFAAAFDNSDPGRTQIARNFFSNMPDEVLFAAVGGDQEVLDAKRINKFRDMIPNAYAVIMEECAVRCGLSH
jgi:oxalate decarboxylase/phosphoglucose isomerase-like protein (cupin superfamily)